MTVQNSDNASDDIPSSLRVEKLAEIAKARERADDFLTEGLKHIVLLNSGGIATILAFLQALAGKSSHGVDLLTAFKPYGAIALGAFIVGAFLGSCVFAIRIAAAYKAVLDGAASALMLRTLVLAFAVGGAVLFFVGATQALIGVIKVF